MHHEENIDDFLSLIEDFTLAITKRYGRTVSELPDLLIAVDEFDTPRMSAIAPGVADACRLSLSTAFSDVVVEDCNTQIVKRALKNILSRENFWVEINRLSEAVNVDVEPDGSGSSSLPVRDELQINIPLQREICDAEDKAFVSFCADAVGFNSDDFAKLVEADLEVISRLKEANPEKGNILSFLRAQSDFASVFDHLRSEAAGTLRHQVSRQLALAYLGFARGDLSFPESAGPSKLRIYLETLTIFLRGKLDAQAIRNTKVSDVFSKYFDDLYGMEFVKRHLLRHVRALVGQQHRASVGLRQGTMTMHLAFLGSPGTGKTEVARRYGMVLKDLGVLEIGDFHEVGKSDLVGKYLGQTEAKTKKVVEKALGSVLFIDEAYALDEGFRDDQFKGYGVEAIEVLVAELENQRAHFMAIFAGYTNEMAGFFEKNPGLRSRIPTSLIFPDLGVDELTKIGLLMISKEELNFGEGFVKALSEGIAARMETKDFGNARGVRNLIEDIRRKQEERLADLGEFATETELTFLVVDDVPEPSVDPFDQEVKHRRIGFIQEER